jgi:hypothetical protein
LIADWSLARVVLDLKRAFGQRSIGNRQLEIANVSDG